MNSVKISIITITFNSERTVEETIESVVSQSYSNLEYIIIDGGSTDNTLNIVDKYRDNISKIISEKDEGISDAFNKGIHLASGELIGIINSDDILMPGALEIISDNFEPMVDVYRGNLILWNDIKNRRFLDKPSMVIEKFPFNTHVDHPSTFISSIAYNKWGLYRKDLNYLMDYELLYRFYKNGAIFKHIDAELAMFRLGGTTNTSFSSKKYEFKKVIKLNGGNKLQIVLFYRFLVCKNILKLLLNLFSEDCKRIIKYKPSGLSKSISSKY